MHDHADLDALTSATTLPRAFASRLALLLVRTGDRVAAVGHVALEERLGLSGRDYTALAVIAEDAPSSQQELAKLMGKAPALCVGMLDDMEAAGLIARGRDPRDRRRSVVTLTPKGEDTLRQADEIALEIETRVIADFTDAERKGLLALLQRVDTSGPEMCAPELPAADAAGAAAQPVSA
ncbi:MAG: MarR family transcriptional regulator [Solirubrobacteraceae bacterium]|nr:MarR family transcriptional regulator [Solirubrobacteraceae bacterium]